MVAVGGCVKGGSLSRLRVSGANGGLVLFVLALSALSADTALAAPDGPHTEFFTGFDASDNAAGFYAGGGYAFGNGLYEEGWRVRAVGSFGRYNYDGTLPSQGSEVPVTFDGEDSFGAALIGYQFRHDALFLKLFAGIEAEDQHIVPHDPHNAVQGSELGLKLQAESWFDLSSRVFLSLDASYGTAFQEYWSLARAGYRLGPSLAVGLEGGALGNEEYNAGRGGGFMRLDFRKVEITLSGGFTGNYLEDEPSGYVSLGVYRAF